MRDVRLDRVLADDELRGDLGVRPAACEQPEHLGLADRERVERRAAAARAAPRSAKRSISRRVTAGANSEPPSAMTWIAARSCASGASLSRKPLAPARRAANTYSSRSKVVSTSTRGGSGHHSDLPRRLDPVHARHPHVHQDDVGPQLASRRDRLDAVAGLADDLEPGVGAQNHPEAGTNEPLVVGEENANHSGNRARTA